MSDPKRPPRVAAPTVSAAERAARSLDAGLVAAYERDGFVAPLTVLSRDEIDDVRDAVDRVRGSLDELEPELYEVEAAYGDRPDDVVCHFLGGWLVDPRLRELVSRPAITVPLAQLLGVDRLRFWHDQVFYKPAAHPGVVPWHQDYSYWTRTTPPRHITLNLMLDRADDESGCLQFVPGSHRWPLLPPLPFDAPLEAVRNELTPQQRDAFRPVSVHLEPGQASVHHSHTLHGSAANRSSHARRAVVLNYMAADVRVADADAPLLRGVPSLPRGAVVDGPHFPIVLDVTS